MKDPQKALEKLGELLTGISESANEGDATAVSRLCQVTLATASFLAVSTLIDISESLSHVATRLEEIRDLMKP